MGVTDAEIFAAILSLRDATDGFSQRTELRFDRMEGRMGQIEGQMGRLEGRMGHLEIRIGRIETRIGHLEDGQREVRAELIEMNRRSP